ncbi:MAG TPA: MFS transporter [Micromonosporaceae bacterium]
MPNRWALLSLTLGYFTLGTTLNSVVGVVEPLAQEVGVAPSRIAFLVTVFAVLYAIAAPALQMTASRRVRGSLLVGLGLIAAGGLLSAVAGSYPLLLTGRAVAAIGAGLFGPTALAAGTRMVPARFQGRALGTVFGGMSAANLLGVPLVSWLTHLFGFQPALLGVALLALVAMVPVALLIPPLPGAGRISPRVYGSVLRAPGVATTVAATGLWMAASYSIFALASAYLAARFHAGPSLVALVLLVYGTAGITGNVIATRYTDRLGPTRLVRLAQSAFAVTLLMMLTLPARPGYAVVVVIVWGLATQMLHPPQQSRLVSMVPDHRAITLAINSSVVYLGISLGASFSGTIFDVGGAGWLPIPAVLLLIASVLAIELPRRRSVRRIELPRYQIVPSDPLQPADPAGFTNDPRPTGNLLPPT